MIIKFKVIPSNRDEWLGWFGDDLIKVRVNNSDLEKGLIEVLKKDLGIEKDWYALKHKRSDLLDAKLSTKHAQEAAGHKNEATTKIYTVTADERRREEVKNVDISLTG